MAIRVAVTGAGGKTGSAVVAELVRAGAAVVPIARSPGSLSSLPPAAAANGHLIDVLAPDAVSALAAALAGCEALVIATSAVPVPVPGATAPNGWPVFTWKEGQTPEQARARRRQRDASPTLAAAVCYLGRRPRRPSVRAALSSSLPPTHFNRPLARARFKKTTGGLPRSAFAV
jgi:hypothetical protein